MNFLITGANSCLSKNFLKYLKTNFPKEALVIGTNRNGNDQDDFDKIYKADFFKKDFEKINEKFDYVFHVASAVPSKYQKKEDFYSINLEGSLEFFKKLKLKKNSKIMNISSMSVYEKSYEKKIFENSQKSTNDHYGISKLLFERELNKLFRNSEISVLSLRVPCLLVPNVDGNFIVKMVERIKNDEKVILSNIDSKFNAAIDGNSLIEFVLNFKYNSKKEAFNMASEEKLTILEMAKTLSRLLGKELNFDEVESNYPCQILKTNKAEVFGFKPPSLENVLNEYILNH
ncbi:MAG: hypothetical protein CBB97_00830 [Candidatus Endolissoclinum sp. TMED37]|nr:MAG: hypothetical protein CBB97_00830 [Candidatus Endolissoclinum sp. TMED37]